MMSIIVNVFKDYQRKIDGFTLTELLAVIMILSILALLTAPNFSYFYDGWVLRSTAHMIAADLRRIQTMSIQTQASYQMYLDTKGFYYILRNKEATGEILKRVELDPRITTVTSDFYDPNYGGSKTGIRTVSFSCLGGPNQAGNIILKTRNGRSIKLTVVPATGRVSVIEP